MTESDPQISQIYADYTNDKQKNRESAYSENLRGNSGF